MHKQRYIFAKSTTSRTGGGGWGVKFAGCCLPLVETCKPEKTVLAVEESPGIPSSPTHCFGIGFGVNANLDGPGLVQLAGRFRIGHVMIKCLVFGGLRGVVIYICGVYTSFLHASRGAH